MSEIVDQNFTIIPLADIPKADIYRRCLFSRGDPFDDNGVKKGHRLFPGDDTPRVFIDCGMQNIEPTPGSSVAGQTRCDVIELAVAFTEEIEVDGVVVSSEEFHDSIYHGTWDTQTETYDRTGAPSSVPVDYTP